MNTLLKRRTWRPRLLVAVALAALVPAAVMAVVPVSDPPPALLPVDINISPGDQFDPHVSGDWVAYTSDLSLRYYNFSSHIDAGIPMGSSVNDLLAGVSGSKIVFSRVIVGYGTAVMVFDAATPAIAPQEIDPLPGSTRFATAIGGNTVAYIDFGLQASGELVIHDLTTSTSVRITNDTALDQNPSVSPNGDVVVWEHCASSSLDCDVWQAVKTGVVWTVSVVSGSVSPEMNPATNGSLVVYDSLRAAGDSNLFWRTVSGGAEVPLQVPGFQNNPNIAGDFVAFEHRPTLLNTSDIFVYDIVNNRLFQITDTPFVNEQLNDITVLPDGSLRVVWSSDEDGFDQRNIKGATFRVSDVVITTATLPDGTVGSPYSVTLTASGGTLPYNWDSGPLPPGLTMDFSTGVISGTPTAIGTYVLSIFVADAVGGFDSKSLTLIVNPAPTPPVLHVPGTITVNATTRAGAIVTYVVTATDAVDPHPVVDCLPASGASFPVGTTTVICRATNASGLSSRATFDVIVKGAAAQVVDLIALLKRFKIRIGIDNSLEAKLQNILAALLAGGRTTPIVCAQLDAFLGEVDAQTGRAITASQAAQLAALANQIKAVLGCP